MNPETRIQISVIKWWDYAASGFGLEKRDLSHCPNGGKRGKIEASILKAMGVRAGYEDLFLAVPVRTCPGLYIEMKAPTGRIELSQTEMMKLHTKRGYAVTVCWCFDEAVRAITNYLKTGDPFKKS